MLKNRIRGLWNAYHCILALVLTVLYWVFLIALSPVIQGWPVAHYPPFILYNVAAVLGLIIAAVRGRSTAATLLAGGFVNYHTLALKQTCYIGVVLLLTLALGMEPEFQHMRIAWFFAFLGAVYAVFLVCHFLVPSRLADQLFSDDGNTHFGYWRRIDPSWPRSASGASPSRKIDQTWSTSSVGMSFA